MNGWIFLCGVFLMLLAAITGSVWYGVENGWTNVLHAWLITVMVIGGVGGCAALYASMEVY